MNIHESLSVGHSLIKGQTESVHIAVSFMLPVHMKALEHRDFYFIYFMYLKVMLVSNYNRI